MNRTRFLVTSAAVVVGLPLLLWSQGDAPRRTWLKDALSLVTLLSFCLLLGQFYLSRLNDDATRALGRRTAVRVHRVVGYVAAAVLLVHPILLVLPRALESGVTPQDALLTLVTTLDSRGVVLGLAAWGLLVVLGATSLARGHLPLSHRTWRRWHGVLSVLFIVAAVWHAVDLGRHMSLALSLTVIVLAAGGAGLFAAQCRHDLVRGQEVPHD